jgi:hypothetical protein
MKMREEDGAKFARGGILADAMGLGESTCAVYVFAVADSAATRKNGPDHWYHVCESIRCVFNLLAARLLTPGFQTIRTARQP